MNAGSGRAAACLALVFGATAGTLPCLAQQYVRAVRFWSLEEVTRVAIETEEAVQYRWERLSNPDRLFFDILDAVPAEHRKGIRVIPVGDKLLRQIRVAETQPGTTRVVLDLTGAMEFSASQLANPSRLIVELRPARPAPVQADPARQPLAEPREAAPARPLAPPPVLEAKPPLVPPVDQPPKAAGAVAPTDAAAEPRPAAAPPKTERQPAPREAPGPVEIGQAAKRDSRGSRSLIRALGLKVGRVVLDPGHGGHDTGTIGPGGLAEKEIVLDIARRLGKLVAERMGSEVVYTRTDDRFVLLEERTQLANDQQADLFLSIHANSSRLRGISGVETFYLNFTTSADALEVAARENASSSRTIHELQDLVQKIAQKEKVQESREFAMAIQKALHGSLRSAGTRNRGVKKAPFVVLAGAQMPSVLVETAFLSNPREERLLKRPEYRQRIAEALYKGLTQYAGTLSHFQVARKNP